MVLARHQYLNDVIDKAEFKRQLRVAVDTLGKSVEILKQEPDSLPEGQLANMAATAYQQLNDNFDVLIETAWETKYVIKNIWFDKKFK